MNHEWAGDIHIESFRAKLEEHLDKTGDCWLWTAGKCKGYGMLHVRGLKNSVYAHRVAYQLAKGSIPDGLVVDHICFTPNCCNPDHLQLLTLSANSRRRNPALASSYFGASADIDGFKSIAQASEVLGIAKATIYNQCYWNVLPYVRIEGFIYISDEALAYYLEHHSRKAGPRAARSRVKAEFSPNATVFSKPQAAAYMDIAMSTLYQQIRLGTLKVSQAQLEVAGDHVATREVITREECDRYVRENKGAAGRKSKKIDTIT